MQENLSTKLTRIKDATNSIRETIGVESNVIEEVAVATSTKITELNTEITTKDEALNAKTLELEETIRNKEADIATAVTEATAAKDLIIEEKNATIKEIGKFRRYDSKEAIEADSLAETGNIGVALKLEETLNVESLSGVSLTSLLFQKLINLKDTTTTEIMAELNEVLSELGASRLMTVFRSSDYAAADAIGCLFQLNYQTSRLTVTATDLSRHLRFQVTYLFNSSNTAVVKSSSPRLTDTETGEVTTLTDDYEFLFSSPVNFVSSQIPAHILKALFNSEKVTYSGIYKNTDAQWTPIKLGFSIPENKVLLGTTYKTDEGEKLGTLGADLNDSNQLSDIAKLLSTVPSKNWVPTLSYSNFVKAIHKDRTTLSPLMHLVDWDSYVTSGNTTSFFNGLSSLETFNLDDLPDYFKHPTTLWSYLSGCKNLKSVNLDSLDTTNIYAVYGMFANVDYNAIKDYLSKPRTVGLQMTQDCFDAIANTDIIELRNRVYTEDMDMYHTFDGTNGITKYLLLENVVFQKEITDYYTIFSNDSAATIEGICIKDCDLKFKNYTYTNDYNDKVSAIFDDVNIHDLTLKNLILDIDHVLKLNLGHGSSGMSKTALYKGQGYIYVRDALVTTYKSHSYFSSLSSKIKPLSEMPNDLREIFGYDTV